MCNKRRILQNTGPVLLKQFCFLKKLSSNSNYLNTAEKYRTKKGRKKRKFRQNLAKNLIFGFAPHAGQGFYSQKKTRYQSNNHRQIIEL